MTGHRRSRKWLAFGVRTLLILVLAIAAWLGRWVTDSREQRAAVAAVLAFDPAANILYDNEAFVTPGGMGGLATTTESRPWWLPPALERWLGRDCWFNVSSMAFGEGSPAPNALHQADLLDEVARMRRLQQLVLYFPVSDADLPRLTGLKRLTRLGFGAACPELTDAGLDTLTRLSGLEALDIRDARITDAGIIHLRRMSRLKWLTLGEAQPFSTGGSRFAFTGTGFAPLASLRELTELEVHSTGLTGDGLRHVGSLGRLKRLRLKGGSFEDDDLRLLAPLRDLESLEIVGASIDGTGIRHLAGLSKISEVCLEGPNVTDAAIPHLARLPALRSLMLYGTRVTAAGLEEFRDAPRLRQMGLIPAVPGDTARLKGVLPGFSVLNGGRML